MKKLIYKSIGIVAFSLGIAGVFLPLLPSTCFILLASWAFAKSSQEFYTWLHCKSPFAKSLQNWQLHGAIPKKVKWIATLSILFSFSISTFVIKNSITVICLGCGMIVLLAYLLTRPNEPNREQQITLTHTQGLRQPTI